MGLFGSSALSMQRKNLPQRLIFRSPTLNNRNYSVKDTKYTEKDNTNKETPAKQIHSVDYQNNTNNNLHSYKNKFGNYCEGKTQHTTQLLDDFVFGPDAWTGPIRTELNDGKIFYFRADGTWSQDTAYLENKLEKCNESLREEINLQKLKTEILMDLLTERQSDSEDE